MILHERTLNIVTTDKNSVVCDTIKCAFLNSNAYRVNIESFDGLHQVSFISNIPNIMVIPLNWVTRQFVSEEYLVREGVNKSVSYIAISYMVDETVIQKFTNINIPFSVVPHVVFRHYLEFALKRQPHQIEEKNIINQENRLKRAIAEYIQYIGVPVHLKGYQYICSAIFLLATYPNDSSGITKVVYPTVAKIHKTTASRVERAMRNAIGIARDRSWETFKYIFGCPFVDYRPTNNEFLSLIKEYFLREAWIQTENHPPQKVLAS